MSKWSVGIGWDDCPHLDERTKAELLEAIPPYQREARSKGIPSLGSGMIYPVPEDVWLVDDFAIPQHWPRAFGLDVGWNITAAVWGAYNADTDTVYFYSEHYVGQAGPAIHADAIRSRGLWIPGVIDPASAGASQVDGKKLIEEYADFGLDLQPADNAVEAGIMAQWRRMSSGRLKVMRSLTNWRSEQRLYSRDENGKIVKKRDHALDAGRYLLMSGMQRAITRPRAYGEWVNDSVDYGERDSRTGY
jgi:hypothetical protein